MTEQEIIKSLKGNVYKGVCLGFMPDDVKRWCNQNKEKLHFYFDYRMGDDGIMEHEWLGYSEATFAIEDDFGNLSERNIVTIY